MSPHADPLPRDSDLESEYRHRIEPIRTVADDIDSDIGGKKSRRMSLSMVPVMSIAKDGRKIIGFTDDDPENPYNWSLVCPRFCILVQLI